MPISAATTTAELESLNPATGERVATAPLPLRGPSALELPQRTGQRVTQLFAHPFVYDQQLGPLTVERDRTHADDKLGNVKQGACADNHPPARIEPHQPGDVELAALRPGASDQRQDGRLVPRPGEA